MLRRWGMMCPVSNQTPSERNQRWAATMEGFEGASETLTVAHENSFARVDALALASTRSREARERQLDDQLAPGATRGEGAGHRHRDEEPDQWRTCFERDRDRILHSNAFRRLAGKTQVFIFPEDHMRTRLTHALEVAQVATGIARPLGLNVALTEAIALGHDCGHGPGGHASEEALDPFVEGGFDHATWGADVALRDLNLCVETLDGIRNHSWSRPAPLTPEGEVVSWADRVAYVCHDFEDALSAGVVGVEQLPAIVLERCGARRGHQLGAFINAVIDTVRHEGVVGMDARHAEALAAFRGFNYEHIYLRGSSREQALKVVSMLRTLVEHYSAHPLLIPNVAADETLVESEASKLHAAVDYVAGMTDRFACRAAVTLLEWPIDQLPNGIDR
ncbi:MAG TPA: HD domain-containing protein [Acidimicrobiales bacterium]|nr:HD domain-containing protein [Acidimicrobiales bacterium]